MNDTNDDRALLELAAKAAGLEIDKSPYNGGGVGNTGFDAAGNAVLDWHNGKSWNPLTDDSDAFRLLVTIGAAKGLTLDIGPGGSCVTVNHPFCDADEFQTPGKPHDPRAATRRAIVRAAAKLVQEKAP